MGEDYYLYLTDYRNRLIAIDPDMINFVYPTNDPEKCLIFFKGEAPPRLFAHKLYDIINALDTFYNAI